MYDIVIIGGGCVGNYLALILSEQGFKIIVIEKKSDAGLNICCTGIISADCCKLLSNKIQVKSSRLNTACIIAPYSRRINIHSNTNIAYIVERSELEKSLASQARYNGASIIYSTIVKDISTMRDRVIINTSNNGKIEQFESKMVIIATGYGTKLPLAAGFDKIDKYVIGAQAEVDISNCNNLEIYLDKKLSPSGFAWLIPTWNNKGFAGLLCKSNPVAYMERFLQLLKSQDLIANETYTINYQPIPIKPLKNTCAERIIIVGEAAGQVKPLTGGGIYYGIICADIAVEIVKDAFNSNDFSCKQLAIYQQRWHKLLKKELTIAYHLRYIWEKLNNETIGVIFKIANRLNIEERINNSNSIYFDWHIKTLSNLLTSLMPFAKSK